MGGHPAARRYATRPSETSTRRYSQLFNLSTFPLRFFPVASVPKSLIHQSGRSLNSSKLAFDDMGRQALFYLHHAPAPYTQQAPQTQITPAVVPRKRQLAGSEVQTPNFPLIQPRPPGVSPAQNTPGPAEHTGQFRPSPGDSAGEPVRKRRGRPSNAQIEQEKAAAAAEGREWQPRPPRPPRKKKNSKTTRESSSMSMATPQQDIPQTPEVQMVEQEEEETSTGKKRRRKAQEESAVVRPPPYDPVRQSPSGPLQYTREGAPASPHQPLQSQPQPATTTLNPEYHRPTTETKVYSEGRQQMQTEQ